MLPVLTYTHPSAAADALRWRGMTLDIARAHAAELGLAGAAFAWRTIHGEECSGYWPAGTAAFHINADIAAAVVNYLDATDDEEFEREVGLPILIETARLWRSLGQHDANGQFRIEGVTGPDEYSAIKDNNLYTNLMAQHNLAAAADLVEKRQFEARDLGVIDRGSGILARRGRGHVHPVRRVPPGAPAARRLHQVRALGLQGDAGGPLPAAAALPVLPAVPQAGGQAGRRGARHADAPGRLHPRAEAAATSTTTSPSPSGTQACRPRTQAVMAAEVGHLNLAYDYLAEAAFMDLQDREHNTKDGLHIASLAGAWTALVSGFGGMRTVRGQLCFNPKLPPGIVRLSFRMRFRGRIVLVAVHDRSATYTLLDGEPLDIAHYGEHGDGQRQGADPRHPGHRPAATADPAPRPRPPAPPRPLQLARSPPTQPSAASPSPTAPAPASKGHRRRGGSRDRGLPAAPASVHPERKRLTPNRPATRSRIGDRPSRHLLARACRASPSPTGAARARSRRSAGT